MCSLVLFFSQCGHLVATKHVLPVKPYCFMSGVQAAISRMECCTASSCPNDLSFSLVEMKALCMLISLLSPNKTPCSISDRSFFFLVIFTVFYMVVLISVLHGCTYFRNDVK